MNNTIFEQGGAVVDIFTMLGKTVGQWFGAVDWPQVYSVTRTVFFYLDLALLVGVIVLWIEGKKVRPRFYSNPMRAIGEEKKKLAVRDEALRAQWLRVIQKSESAPPQSLTLAIIEADSFIDTILKDRLKLPGEHMADRLDRLANEDFASLNRLWAAHRVRNDLVHTPGFFLAAHDARRILQDYEAFLKELDVL